MTIILSVILFIIGGVFTCLQGWSLDMKDQPYNPDYFNKEAIFLSFIFFIFWPIIIIPLTFYKYQLKEKITRSIYDLINRK